jgi:hypothetical protein
MKSTGFCFGWVRLLAGQSYKGVFVNLAVWTAIVFVVFPSTTRAEIKGDPQLLKTAAALYRANLEKLKTWRGRAVMTHRSVQEDQHAWVTVVSIDFAYDRKSGASRWAIDPQKCVEVVGEKETPRIELLSDYGMHLNGAYYELRFRPAGKGGSRRGWVAEKRTFRPGYSYLTFDPMFFFTHEGGDHDKFLLMICENVKHPEAEGSITREGNHVVFSQVMPAGSGTGLDEMDLSQGGNPVHISSVFRPENGPERLSVWEWTWEKINDVWVPKTATKELSGARERTIHLVWEENRVNEPLRKDEYSPARMGLRPGDQLHDIRTDATYTIEGPEFPPALRSKAPPSPKSP